MTDRMARTALTHALRAVEVRLRELGPVEADPGHGNAVDQEASRQERETHVLSRAGLTERQRLIDEALERLAAGAYGQCLSCGERIAGKRLAAMPWARRCLLCEQRLEVQERRPLESPEPGNA